MKSFPKKYNPKELRNRSKLYRDKNINDKILDSNTIFSVSILPSSKKLSYTDFFEIYLKDFFNYKTLIQDSQNYGRFFAKNFYEQLFITYWDQFQNIASSYEFFGKRNQSLLQVWVNKLERRILSSTRKCLNANNKIIDSYLSSSHKIYIPDSDLYLYVLKKFHDLWDKWKITNKTKIWYWSFNLQTSIPEEKILWKEEETPYYMLKYFVWAKCEALPICVEDIDSCCGDVALLVHPKDKRYNKYIWKNAIIPLCNRQIPIIWYDKVNIALNNWIKRVCPCSDEESIGLAQELWLPMDVYVFDKQWLYTQYIHEPAFVWKRREKYYNNIVWFIEDIWNLSSKGKKLAKIPYLSQTNERLVPYKIDQLIIDLKEEKEKIIDEIFEKKLKISFLNWIFWETLDEIIQSQEINIDDLNDYINRDLDEDKKDDILDEDDIQNLDNLEWENEDELQKEKLYIKQKIIDEIASYLPDSLVCNTQIPYGWKIPLLKDSEWNLMFFDVEKESSKWKKDCMQNCFDFVILSLVRSWAIWMKSFVDNDEFKLCECDKLYYVLSENEKKIQYFIQYYSQITWKDLEYDKFLEIISNLTNETNSSIKDLWKLVKNSKYLKQEWNWLLLTMNGIVSDTIDPDFVQLCIPCYLKERNININHQVVFSVEERSRILKELLIQNLLLWSPIFDDFLENSYDKKNEFLWNKQLTKLQLEQTQWDLFSIYWENPIRLNLLVDKTFDQKKIIINSIFLKQVWNVMRFCVQNDLLPSDVADCLNNIPQDFDDFDVCVLENLNEIFNDWEDIKTYDQYVKFFDRFKDSIQNVFFSWYLEIQKVHKTKDVNFVCSYFFNFVLTVLYPSVPEFVDALQYISERNFVNPFKPVKLNKTTDYAMNIIFRAFIKIKQIKVECGIKQHESCNLFIKSTPTIWDIFVEYEQLFKNYFHISNIMYVRLHELNPLWYETFSDDEVVIWIQHWEVQSIKKKDSIEILERDIKNLEDKIILLRQRIQILPEWEERFKAEEEYAKTKEEMENLSIKHSLLSSK